MQINYCLPVIERSKGAVLSEIVRHEKDYACFEIWLDYIKGADVPFVRRLVEKYPGKLIFLFRRQKLGRVRMPLEDRKRIMQALNGQKAFLDLDVSQKEELDFLILSGLKVRLIGSYHNYRETPGTAELQHIASTIAAHKPEAVKIATFCKSEEDALRLLYLQLWLKHYKRDHIVLGMGPYGAVTRVFGTLWGNELIFAPERDDEMSAPGQLTRGQLENIFRSLGI